MNLMKNRCVCVCVWVRIRKIGWMLELETNKQSLDLEIYIIKLLWKNWHRHRHSNVEKLCRVNMLIRKARWSENSTKSSSLYCCRCCSLSELLSLSCKLVLIANEIERFYSSWFLTISHYLLYFDCRNRPELNVTEFLLYLFSW